MFTPTAPTRGSRRTPPALEIPYKKTRARPLAKDERDYNHALSRFRVRVEHRIARLKSFRILAERYRYPRKTYAAKISIVAGVLNVAAGFRSQSTRRFAPRFQDATFATGLLNHDPAKTGRFLGVSRFPSTPAQRASGGRDDRYV